MKKLTGSVNVNSSSGFTLVELLIVVIILAVLAAIVVPQFSSSTDEAKEAALRSTLLEMRNAVELYYHQHNSKYPGYYKTDGTGASSTDAEAQAAFLNQLTLYTDINGKTAVAKDLAADPPIKYGPYLKRSNLPLNPIDDSSTVTLVISGPPLLLQTRAGGLTWYQGSSSPIRLATALTAPPTISGRRPLPA